MAKRKLAEMTKPPKRSKKSPLDLADEVIDRPPQARQIGRSTDRMSISLLAEERTALEDLSTELRRKGHRDLKPSRLARVAFRMLLEASENQVLKTAGQVPDLEQRRVVRRSED